MRRVGEQDHAPADTAGAGFADAQWPSGRRAAVLGAMLALAGVAVLGEGMAGTTPRWLVVVDVVIGVVGSVFLVARGRVASVPRSD